MTISNDKLSHQQIDQLLDLLSVDDEFRARFSADPGEALKQIGWTAGSPECMRVGILADKAQIIAARDQLRKQFIGFGSHTVIFQLDAGTVSLPSHCPTVSSSDARVSSIN